MTACGRATFISIFTSAVVTPEHDSRGGSKCSPFFEAVIFRLRPVPPSATSFTEVVFGLLRYSPWDDEGAEFVAL